MNTALDTTDDVPATAAALPDILRFMQLLWALAHGLQTTSKRMTHAVGITGPQRLALRVIGLFPGVSAGDLALILHLHPSTLTGVLQRLVSQQLDTRIGDPGDRRRAVLRLTPRGLRANARRRGTVEAAIGRALEGITERDRKVTRRVLGRLAEYLDRAQTAVRVADQLPPRKQLRKPSRSRLPHRS